MRCSGVGYFSSGRETGMVTTRFGVDDRIGAIDGEKAPHHQTGAREQYQGQCQLDAQKGGCQPSLDQAARCGLLPFL